MTGSSPDGRRGPRAPEAKPKVRAGDEGSTILPDSAVPHPPTGSAAGPLPLPAGEGSISLARLKIRPQFLAAAKGAAFARGAVLIQALDRQDARPVIGAGFTATKRIGNAVVRNRCKRRLREAARALLPLHGRPGFDYVFIARNSTADRPWDRLLDDVKTALLRLAEPRSSAHMQAEPRPQPPKA